MAAQAEGVSHRVGVDLPAVAVGSDEVPLQGRAELDHATLFGLDDVHLKVEVELLWVFVLGPAWCAIVVNPLKCEVHLPEADHGHVLGAAHHESATSHLRVEGRQTHRVRAVDDETQQLQHATTLPRWRSVRSSAACPFPACHPGEWPTTTAANVGER